MEKEASEVIRAWSCGMRNYSEGDVKMCLTAKHSVSLWLKAKSFVNFQGIPISTSEC